MTAVYERERRVCRRRTRSEEHDLAVRVRPGHDASVVNVSPEGALIETRHRLLPGSFVDLQLTGGGRRLAVRGRVLRCAVARLRAGAIWYRGAILFDRSLPWFTESGGEYSVPNAENGCLQKERGEATHG